jgi:hypothetical protein
MEERRKRTISGPGKTVRGQGKGEDGRPCCTRAMVASAASGKFSLRAGRDIEIRKGLTFMGWRTSAPHGHIPSPLERAVSGPRRSQARCGDGQRLARRGVGADSVPPSHGSSTPENKSVRWTRSELAANMRVHRVLVTEHRRPLGSRIRGAVTETDGLLGLPWKDWGECRGVLAGESPITNGPWR